MKVAFFDSGIGGLSVFQKTMNLFPNHHYVYFGDSQNAPYGSKTKEEVRALILDAVDFLSKESIDILVLACHTASKLIAKELQQLYDFPIIGMQTGIPSELFKNGKEVVVCGTDLSTKTWEASLQTSSLNANYLSLNQLVSFAEKGEINTAKTFAYLHEKLTSKNWNNCFSIVLGCTHFPFFKKQIQTILPKHVQIYDGSMATIEVLKPFLAYKEPYPKPVEYFLSKTKQEAAFYERCLVNAQLLPTSS